MEPFYEPFSPIVREDPYPIYRALRDRAPIHRAEQADAWVLSRHADVEFVFKHPELFSSEAMGAALSGRAPGGPSRLDVPRVVILMDPPEHSSFRNLLNRGFTPRRIALLEGRLREITADAIARMRARTTVELVADLAAPVPVIIIAELLGIEPERMPDFKRWSDDIVAGVTGSERRVQGDDEVSLGPSMEALRAYLGDLVASRRSSPKDDLLSVLVREESGEAALSHEEVVLFALVLLIAGNETTTNLIGSAVQQLLQHPAELAKAQADPTRVPKIVEETLRYESPVQFIYRRARKDVEFHGVKIAEGELVIALVGSANRDERRFPVPDRFDIERDTSGHLSFGFGIHFCLGASLARLEARVVLEAMLDELPYLKSSGQVVENVDSFMMRGPRALYLERSS